jgi:hypothetical protein
MMSYKLTVSGLAGGQAVQIDGVGALSNGTYGIDDETSEAFKVAVASYMPETPTLLQAFKNHPYITVETTTAEEFEKLKKRPETEPVIDRGSVSPGEEGDEPSQPKQPVDEVLPPEDPKPTQTVDKSDAPTTATQKKAGDK